MTDRSTVLPLLRASNIIVRELQGELLIYDVDSNNALCLNPAARLIADHCDGVTTIGEVVDKLARGADADAAEVLVLEVVSRLEKEGLLATPAAVLHEAALPSRRQVLAAAASLGAALPLVSLLLVPTPMAAQSGCIGQAQSCTNGGAPCCSGTQCTNTETGPTSFTCEVCIAAGQACVFGETVCCGSGICVNTEAGPTGFQCVQPPG